MEQLPTLIIGIGYKARNGKDTCAKHIVEKFGLTSPHGYDIRKYAFGDILKEEVYDALSDWRRPEWERHNYFKFPHPPLDVLCPSREEKVAWVDANKKDPNFARLLQHWGTEYRRQQNPFYWVQALDAVIKRERPQIAVISDMRFRNEYYWVTSHKGYTVKVTRVGFELNDGRDSKHVSETELDGIKFHFEIEVLDGGEEQVVELKRDAEIVFTEILKAYQPEVPDFSLDAAA